MLDTFHVQAVQQKHMHQRGWTDIGYHYVIAADGTIYEGRNIGVRGTHVEGANTGKVGVLLLGDFQPGPTWSAPFVGEVYSDVDDVPSSAQIASARSLTVWLDTSYGIDEVVAHRDLNSTECPGDTLMPFMPLIANAIQQ
jgi:hypothetical protein